MSEAKRVPLPDLLRGVPRTKGLNIEEPNCTHHIPIGILAHEAADLIEQQAKELAEAKAKEIYESWRDQNGYVPWVAGGNSDMQDKARRIAASQKEQGNDQ